MFSKACEYGIKSVIYIAQQSGRGQRVSLKEIATEVASPEAFTAKILQQLARAGVVESVKGPGGGFQMMPGGLDQVMLIDIVRSIDGDAIFDGCGLGLQACNADMPCPVHDRFVTIRDELKKMLRTTSMRDLAEGIETGATFLKR